MKIETSKTNTRQYKQGARAQAAELTGQRIIDAFLSRLMNEWFDEITLDNVAADAGVTVQTVVRRFGGKAGLLAESVKVLSTQINKRRAAPDGDIDRALDNLIDDYEQVGDMVLRLLALEPRHDVLKTSLDFGRSEHRRWVKEVFSDQLQQVNILMRERALDALVISTDIYTWKLLRRDMKRSLNETKETLKILMKSAIEDLSKAKGKTGG